MKSELTVEESNVLIKLGLDPKLASSSVEVPCGNMVCHEKVFTFTDILSKLMEYSERDEFGMFYDKKIKEWNVGYEPLYLHSAPELIDALAILLAKLLKLENELKHE